MDPAVLTDLPLDPDTRTGGLSSYALNRRLTPPGRCSAPVLALALSPVLAALLLAAAGRGRRRLRVATYDVGLTRDGAGLLLHDLGRAGRGASPPWPR